MTTSTYLLIRQGSAAKLGANPTGLNHYAILTDAERATLHLALVGNDSGGYFGREAVAVEALRACVESNPADTPLLAAVFKPAYTSRSSNQGGFCAAALCAEGLITRVVHTGEDLPVFHIGKPPVNETTQCRPRLRSARAAGAPLCDGAARPSSQPPCAPEREGAARCWATG